MSIRTNTVSAYNYIMDAIMIWRIVLVLGTLGFLGAMGIFTLKLIAASTGRKRLIDLFIR